MNNNSSTDQNIDVSGINRIELLTPEDTSNVKTLTELWALAKIAKDIEGDPIWDILNQLGCNPEPFGNIGYNFDYKGLKGIYIPMKNNNGLVRFVLPKLATINLASKDEISAYVNMANSFVSESKFAIMGSEVWLLHESFISGNGEYRSMVEHILDNLKCGAEFFYKIS